jgi:hypothetical protein
MSHIYDLNIQTTIYLILPPEFPLRVHFTIYLAAISNDRDSRNPNLQIHSSFSISADSSGPAV